MKRLQDEHSDQNLKIIWIGFQDRAERLREFADKHEMDSVGFDKGNKVAASYGVGYGAGVIFIDTGGMVKKRLAKGFSEHTIRGNVSLILQKKDKTKQKKTSPNARSGN